MAAIVTVKGKYKSTVVGFNNSAKPLGQRDDLHLLAEMALQTGSKTLLNYFDKLPTLKAIQKHKGQLLIDQLKDKESQEPEITIVESETKSEELPEADSKD